MIYKTLGLPLKANNVGEADKIFTILTEDHGRVQAVAKGVRKIQSRKRGNVEIGVISEFSFYEGKNIDTITECQMKEYFSGLRNYEGIKFIFEVLKVCERFATEKESCDHIFPLTYRTLMFADKNNKELAKILCWFRLRIAHSESTIGNYREDPALDDRFKLLIDIFLSRDLNDIIKLNITDETLKKLNTFSLSSIRID